ncbi:MAG: transglutaminase domain-containing protein [Planctomycetes bacterium]|nr:transglutaminase domain-containing protein [Planctomycetota bacterium]
MDRRSFLRSGLGAAVCAGGAMSPETLFGQPTLTLQETFGPTPPAGSLIPVVGDGKWVWNKPPKDQTGYLEPRSYELKIGIKLEGVGNAGRIKATTPVPVQLPEQKIDDVKVEKQGCSAKLRAVATEAGQLLLTAPSIVRGQTIAAAATFQMTLYKQYHGFKAEQFPAEQKVDKKIRRYLGKSPGIQTRNKDVRAMSEKVAGKLEHPWAKAEAFYRWVRKNIAGHQGPYTSVVAAIRDRRGDCEERAAVFVAFCRIARIPARLVWVPNHNWAEFYLHDHDGRGHWIPVHTSAYPWFGWTGAHELVLQKGDRIEVPEKHKPYRLLPDWMQYQGKRPKATFKAELTPVAKDTGSEVGPGSRRKDAKGEWLVVVKHPLDRKLRDSDRIGLGKKSVGG